VFFTAKLLEPALDWTMLWTIGHQFMVRGFWCRSGEPVASALAASSD
jgi:hypothetical protein